MSEEDKLSYWTAERQSILSFLRENALPLADLYEGAVIMLCEGVLAGRERFICHAIREIYNRLPDYLGKEKGERLEYNKELVNISKQWPRLSESESLGLSSKVSISLETYTLINDLINRSMKVPHNNKERILWLYKYFSKDIHENQNTSAPAIGQWHKIQSWFNGRAHDSANENKMLNIEQVSTQFELAEASLASLIAPFYGNIEELDEILEEANN